ncbi:MAG TPA: MFS transporter [Flavisolibacter sp.]|nr:MFS transporter [Flavisolibacter sp.]
MKFKTSPYLTNQQVETGLKQVIKDGLTAEVMVTMTGGTFLMAMAVLMKATNFQIGLMTALPTLTNIFQLFSTWLVQKYNNRRAVMVISSFIARLPLFMIGALPFLFSKGTNIQVLIFMLSFHYIFGSIAGASWSSWMKDLVPEQRMGSYFAHRSRLMMTLNVVLSVALALSLDYIKAHYPQYELSAYAIMFIIGGIFGMLGVHALARTPEPTSYLAKENLFKLFSKPVKDKNFRNLLAFQSFWTFALNLATPFFSVYMMKTMGLSLSYIIGFGLLTQIGTILSIKMWGKYADTFSNKTIISIAAPIYIASILAFTFTAIPTSKLVAVIILAVINIVGGACIAGINLAIDNFGLKLAPKEEAIVYISARNVIVAFISALAPMIGGFMADLLANHSVAWNIHWNGTGGVSTIQLLNLHNWNFMFIAGGILAILSLQMLKYINEEGAVHKGQAVGAMKIAFKNNFKEHTSKEAILGILYLPVTYPIALKRKVQGRIEQRAAVIRRLNNINALRKRA